MYRACAPAQRTKLPLQHEPPRRAHPVIRGVDGTAKTIPAAPSPPNRFTAARAAKLAAHDAPANPRAIAEHRVALGTTTARPKWPIEHWDAKVSGSQGNIRPIPGGARDMELKSGFERQIHDCELAWRISQEQGAERTRAENRKPRSEPFRAKPVSEAAFDPDP